MLLILSNTLCLKPHKKGQWPLHVYSIANFVASWLKWLQMLWNDSKWVSLYLRSHLNSFKIFWSHLSHETRNLAILKVRQIWNDFFKPTFLPKNEQTNSTLLLVDMFSFVSSKKVKTPKRHFKLIDLYKHATLTVLFL